MKCLFFHSTEAMIVNTNEILQKVFTPKLLEHLTVCSVFPILLIS